MTVTNELALNVLGGLILDNKSFYTVADILKGDEFQNTEHREIYAAIHSLAIQNQPADVLTISEFLEVQGSRIKLHDVASIAKGTFTAANVVSYAHALKKKSNQRKALQACFEAQKAIESDGDPSAVFQKALLDMETTNRTPYLAYKDVLQAGFESVREAAKQREENGLTGLSWGLPTLDKYSGGIRGPRLWVIPARPSMGKTALALQVRLAAARQGVAVGAIEAEMDYDEIGQRSLAHRYNVPFTGLSQGNTDTLAQVADGMKLEAGSGHIRMQDYKIYSDANTWTVPGIIARATEWKRKYDIGLLTIDHLHCLRKPNNISEIDFYNDAARAFKLLAKELQIPILLLAQMNRAIEKENRAPRLSDIRGGGGIEEHADAIIFLWGDRETGAAGDRQVNITIEKGRMMKTGTLNDLFRFDGVHQKFIERDNYSEDFDYDN